MHIFLINGPARSGKDTVGNDLAELFGGLTDKFARILKERTHTLYGAPKLPHDAFEGLGPDGVPLKDTPMAMFLDLTPRQAYIQVSETYFKPVHGDGIFAKLLADDWEQQDLIDVSNYFVTDSGFVGEAHELMRRFPDAEVTLIEVEREGHTFDGDSRSRIVLHDPNSTLEPKKIVPVRVLNNGTRADLRAQLSLIFSLRLGVDAPARYRAEVQVPGAQECGNNPQWIEFSDSDDFNLILARVESARRSHYQGRVVRITDAFGRDSMDLGERYIYPGDPSVYDLGVTA